MLCGFYEGCTQKEIQAYRDLQSTDFDFGTGLIKNEGTGEDVFLKMSLYDYWMDCSDYIDQESDDWENHSLNHSFDEPIHHSIRSQEWRRYQKRTHARKDSARNYKCSCSMCSYKTNQRGQSQSSSTGKVKLAIKKRNWKTGDKKKIIAGNQSVDYVYNEDLDLTSKEDAFKWSRYGYIDTKVINKAKIEVRRRGY